jgi:predicted unusual protein kinase regulating ubiquinone biosynthesis (AarF/ABC1/UbiB family)
MDSSKFLSKSWRSRKVYATSFSIALKYIWLFLKGRIFGKKYVQKRLTPLHIKSALRLKNSFLELRGLFIKIGQLVSILSSFLPEEFRKPLEEFQDRAPAQPFEDIKKNIESELGKSLEELFESFEEMPLASASIGQVHRAKLKDGQEVVVKIQHEHIPKIAEIDLQLFENIMRLVARFYKMKGIEHVALQVRQMIEEELDYSQEAEYMSIISQNLSPIPKVVIPKIYPEFCTSKIIVSEFFDGVKINNLAQLDEWEIDRQDLVKRFLEICCHMVLKDGIYHADPHPGNILVTQNGDMILLDFGAVSVVGDKVKTGLADLINAVTKGDSEEIIESMQYMGFVAKDSNATQFSENILEFVQDFLQNEVQMESLNFKDIKVNFETSHFVRLFELISIKDLTNSFQVPKDYILLNRMIILAGGISAELAPQLNPLDVVRPYLRNFVVNDLSDLPKFLFDFVKKNLTNVITLPLEVRKTLLKIRRGEVVVQHKNEKEKGKLNYYLSQQTIWALFLLFSLFIAYQSYVDFQKEYLKPILSSGAIFAILWLRAMFKARKQIQKL